MHRHLFFILLCSFALLIPCRADPLTRKVELTFVPPELEGRYSLGIYDSNGHLIRALHVDDPASAFRIGLNGLVTQWDGRDDQGNPAPPGEYAAHGYVVGDAVDLIGESFHFNDWVNRQDLPGITSIQNFRTQGIGGLLLLVDTVSDGRLLGYGIQKKGVIWLHPVEANATIAGTNQKFIFLREGEKIVARHIEDGLVSGQFSCPRGVSLATDKHFYLFDGDTVRRWKLGEEDGVLQFRSDSSYQEKLSFKPTLGSGFPDGWWAADTQGRCVFTKEGSAPQSISLDPLQEISQISSGRNSSLWVVGKALETGDLNVIAQFDARGEIIRVLTPESDRVFDSVAADSKDDFLLIGDRKNTEFRIRALLHLEEPGSSHHDVIPSINWTTVWQRSLTPCENFGIVGGKLVPDAKGSTDPNLVHIALQKNSLDPDTPSEISLTAKVSPEGSWLATAGGLRLLRVSAQQGLKRGIIIQGNTPTTARFFQGNGSVVEEFLIKNLDQIAAFDCGTFTLESESVQ